MLARVLIFVLLSFCLPAHAGSFKVYPLKLDFDQRQKTALFRITNTGDDAVTVQLEGVKWSQDALGEDVYQPTRDIIFFPKIVKVQKGEERVVRIAYKGSSLTANEKSYRLFAQELPQRAQEQGALSFALRFSVPIFVAGSNTRALPVLEDVSIKNGFAELLVSNQGSEHLLVSDIDIAGVNSHQQTVFAQQSKGWYVLPGKQRNFKIPLKEEDCNKSASIQAALKVKNKILKRNFVPTKSECVHVQVAKE